MVFICGRGRRGRLLSSYKCEGPLKQNRNLTYQTFKEETVVESLTCIIKCKRIAFVTGGADDSVRHALPFHACS